MPVPHFTVYFRPNLENLSLQFNIQSGNIFFTNRRENVVKRNMMIVMIPYLKDIMSKSTLNQWSHAQQPTLIKGHLVIAHLKPKIYSTIMLNL